MTAQFNQTSALGIDGDSLNDVRDDARNDVYQENQNETLGPYANPEMMRHSLAVTTIYCFAYTFVFVVGIFGNVLVMMVVVRTRIMKTTVFYFLFNLALADLLVLLFCVPATLIGNVYTPWMLGLFVCKAVTYLQGVSVSASINTLVAISMERALAICKPMRCQMTSRTCRSIIIFIWIFSLTITLPWAVFFNLETIPDTDLQVCVDRWPNDCSGNLYFVLANLVMCYLLPLTIISVCYLLIWRKVWCRKLPGERQDRVAVKMIQRSKIKVIKMLVIVVVLFALSWLPLYAIFARIKLGGMPTETEANIIHTLAPVAQWLGASNSCINPILYAFFNEKFRAGFRAILVSQSCCSPLRLEILTKSFTSYRTQNFYSADSTKAHSEVVVYSCTTGSMKTRHKSIIVQDSLDGQGQESVTFNSSKKRHHHPQVLHRNGILNQTTNGNIRNIKCELNGNSTFV